MSSPEVRGPDRRDTEQPHVAFGRVLEAARENAGRNRHELAVIAEVAYSMLFNVERGRRRASDGLIEKVAPQIGLRPDRMIKVRNALEVDRKFPLGRKSELQRFMAGAEGVLPASGRALERRLGSLVEDELADLFAASRPTASAGYALLDGGPSGHGPVLAQLVGDLRGLSAGELTRVRGYIDRLVEERTPRTPTKNARGATRKRPPRPLCDESGSTDTS